MPDPIRQKEDDIRLTQLFVPLTSKKVLWLIFAIGFLLFFYSLFNNFVGDDNTQILGNPSIRTLSNIPAFFIENRLTLGGQTRLGGLYYKPLLDTSNTILYVLFGPNPFAYHFVQLAFFIANACLLFYLLKHFFKLQTAFLLSLLFLIHPINAETALYIADIQDVLYTFFGLLALLILLKKNSTISILFVNLLLLFSLFSKETGVLYILIACVFVLSLKEKKRLLSVFLFLTTFVCYFLLRVHAIGLNPHMVISAPIERLSLQERLLNIPSIIVFYLKTFLFPMALSGSWQWAYTSTTIINFYLPLGMTFLFLFLLFFGGYSLNKEKNKKWILFYCVFNVWTLFGLAFHSQLLPLDQTVADRWFYFSIIGFLGLIGIFLERYKLLSKKYSTYFVVILLLLFCLRTFVRSLDFRDDFTLASHDILVSKDSYNSEYIISHTYYDEGKLHEAKIHALRSIALFPYITNYTNLGAIDSRSGDYHGAKTAYQAALQYGEDKLPYENLSSLALVYGDKAESIQFIKNVSLKKYPEDTVLWYNLAILEYMQGDKEAAHYSLEKINKSRKNFDNSFIGYIIKNNKPLRIGVKNGNVTFYTY